MKNFVFLSNSNNRVINQSNVKELYASFKLRGFLPDVSKIEYLQGDEIKESQLVSFKVVPKDQSKPISLTNWIAEFTKVDWNKDLKAIVDGQHSSIAMLLLKELDQIDLIDEAICCEVNLPDGLTISEFVALKNSGKPWDSKTFDDVNISSGNPFIDKISEIRKEEKLLSQVAYDLYSLNSGSLTLNIVKGLKAKTHKLPSTFILNDDSISDGNKILNALKSSTLVNEVYNKTRFSKGLKGCVKDISIIKLVELIGRIDKTVWETYFTPATGCTAEAKFYTKSFITFNSQPID